MLLGLQRFFTPEETARVRALVAQERFIDGRRTAGRLVAAIKNNEELEVSSAKREEINRLFFQALQRNSLFMTGARPKRMTPPIVSRYSDGMTYGDHIDNAIMNGMPNMIDPIRVDLSMTVFLSEPETYTGGELVIESGYGTHQFKLPAGDAVLYPTLFVHRVNPVTRGTRLAVITWIESLVRDPERRTMLFDVAKLAEWVHRQAPDSTEGKLVEKIRMNLLRMWAET
jgi:PKHD-type hydroxylase